MSNLAKKRKVWRRSGRSTERRFWGIAEVFCGRTSGKGASSRDRNQMWWTEEVSKAVCEKERFGRG